MKKYISHDVLVNGLEVNARYSYETVDNILIPLLQKLTSLQAAKKSRVQALFAAPPGTGKSTLLSFLERLASERFVEFSDLRNVRTCLACSSGADLVLEMVSDGSIIIIKD